MWAPSQHTGDRGDPRDHSSPCWGLSTARFSAESGSLVSTIGSDPPLEPTGTLTPTPARRWQAWPHPQPLPLPRSPASPGVATVRMLQILPLFGKRKGGSLTSLSFLTRAHSFRSNINKFTANLGDHSPPPGSLSSPGVTWRCSALPRGWWGGGISQRRAEETSW